jgi:hypothetical protein
VQALLLLLGGLQHGGDGLDVGVVHQPLVGHALPAKRASRARPALAQLLCHLRAADLQPLEQAGPAGWWRWRAGLPARRAGAPSPAPPGSWWGARHFGGAAPPPLGPHVNLAAAQQAGGRRL